jgi:Fur family transcriptional regulator, peroxide stress response regulator
MMPTMPTEVKTISRAEIEAWLSCAGLEMTPQRFAVLQYLARADDAPTAEQVVSVLSRQYPRPSCESVCRTLLTLRDAGIVSEVSSEGACARYAANFEPFAHLIYAELVDD